MMLTTFDGPVNKTRNTAGTIGGMVILVFTCTIIATPFVGLSIAAFKDAKQIKKQISDIEAKEAKASPALFITLEKERKDLKEQVKVDKYIGWPAGIVGEIFSIPYEAICVIGLGGAAWHIGRSALSKLPTRRKKLPSPQP